MSGRKNFSGFKVEQAFGVKLFLTVLINYVQLIIAEFFAGFNFKI